MDLNGQWTRAGRLNQARYGHNVIYDGQHIMVVGGNNYRQTEKCLLNSGTVTCTLQNPELPNYQNYPELFLIPDAFCKN